MGKLFFIMGKSSTGKDTIYQKLLSDRSLCLRPVVPYTTRPVRLGETDGVEYHFTDEAGLEALQRAGKVVELREYRTFYGIWKYFTVDDGGIDLYHNTYLMIGTLASYSEVRDYFGPELVRPVLVELDDGVRLQRALNRERKQEAPGYLELCRRFLADAEDFSEEKINAAGVGSGQRFYNGSLRQCMAAVTAYIRTEG